MNHHARNIQRHALHNTQSMNKHQLVEGRASKFFRKGMDSKRETTIKLRGSSSYVLATVTLAFHVLKVYSDLKSYFHCRERLVLKWKIIDDLENVIKHLLHFIFIHNIIHIL